MTFRFALILAALLSLLAACSQQDPPSADATPVPAVPVTETPAPAAAQATSEPAAAPVAPAPVATPAGPALVPGVDYVDIEGGQPFEPLNGKIEVTEVFGYVCPACNMLQPNLRAWKSRLPADVRLTYVPALFGPDWTPYAHAFYAAESLGLVEKTHEAVYNAIHAQDRLPGEGDKPTDAPIAAFYANYGVSAEQFQNTMKSFAVSGKINKAKQYAHRSKIEGTPTLIINGRYRVQGRTYDDMFRIADALIARERAGSTTPAAAAN